MPKNQAITVDNRLLNLLPVHKAEEFINECELIELKAGQVLANAGEPMAYAYFPLFGIISWEKHIDASAFLVIALIGCEGMLCFSFNLNIDQTSCRATVQKEGFAWRISTEKLKFQLQTNSALATILKRYSYIMLTQLIQFGVCNLFHVIECRLAKIFLMLQDKAKSSELNITQESLAQMLGVRRVGVTKAASAMQRKKIISYSRGHVSIVNSHHLQQQSCNCYQLDKAIYEKYLSAEHAQGVEGVEGDVQDVQYVANVPNALHINLSVNKIKSVNQTNGSNESV